MTTRDWVIFTIALLVALVVLQLADVGIVASMVLGGLVAGLVAATLVYGTRSRDVSSR